MAELAPLDVVAAAPDAAPVSGGQANLTAEQLRIRDALSARSARLVDDIAARSGLSVATVQGVLGAMQLEGTAVERASGWVRTNSSSASQAAAN
jgi:DNA processing protein